MKTSEAYIFFIRFMSPKIVFNDNGWIPLTIRPKESDSKCYIVLYFTFNLALVSFPLLP